MPPLFNSNISPRKLTIEQQQEYAKLVAKYELVDILIQHERLFNLKYEDALYIEANNEAEDCKVMLNVIDLALRYSMN